MKTSLFFELYRPRFPDPQAQSAAGGLRKYWQLKGQCDSLLLAAPGHTRKTVLGRVEMWRGGGRLGLSVAACGPQKYHPAPMAASEYS